MNIFFCTIIAIQLCISCVMGSAHFNSSLANLVSHNRHIELAAPPGFILDELHTSYGTSYYSATGGYTYWIAACGAQAEGHWYGGGGAAGGCMYCQFRLVNDETWEINVGERGKYKTSGATSFNGGKRGGGGGSDVRRGGFGLGSRFAVGGGAGGGGTLYSIVFTPHKYYKS